jgi:CheY-like chemotaxis protein
MPLFKRILLIDDDDSSNFLSSTILIDMDAAGEIEVAKDGDIASDMVQSGYCPEIIFLDIRMPRMGGFDFLDRLRAMEVCKDTKIVMLTSSTRQEDREKAFRYGNVLSYVEKPLTEQKVQHISEEYFN